jgi:uncharacterized protein YodC (DUF2158 family)
MIVSVGDLVKLKSGDGPLMRVETSTIDGTKLICRWGSGPNEQQVVVDTAEVDIIEHCIDSSRGMID